MIIPQVVNGLMLGIMYSVVAVGFTLYFGVLDLIQFAHGDVFMVGAFIGLILINLCQALGIGSPVILLIIAFIGGGILTGLFGVVFARVTVRPIKEAPPIIALLTTLAAGIVIRYLVMVFYPGGSEPQRFPSLLPDFRVATIRVDSIIIMIIGIFLIAGVNLFLRRTKMGISMRAVSQDTEAALMMGVDVDRVIDITFFVGSLLAATAGILNGLYYREVMFNMGEMYGVIGFSAAVIGGLGNIYGAIAGGFLFAAVATLTSVLVLGGAAYKFVAAFAFLIAALVILPQGVLGGREEEVKV